MLESENRTNDRPGVGALLRASRLRLGEGLRDVAAILRIRHLYLEAIEEERYADLPGPTYAIGFVRAYAEHTGLDSDEVVRRFKREISGVQEAADLVFPTPIPERSIPGGAIAFVGVVIAALAYGAWYASTSDQRLFVELIAPLPEKLARLLPGEDAPRTPEPRSEGAAAAAPLGPVFTDDGMDVRRFDRSPGNGHVEGVPAERVTFDPPLPAVRPAPAPVVVVEPIGTRDFETPAPAASETTSAEAPPIVVTATELEAARLIPALEISSADATATDPNKDAVAIPGGAVEEASPAVVFVDAVRTTTEDGSEVRPRQSGGVPEPPIERAFIGGAPAGTDPEPSMAGRGADELLRTGAGRDPFVGVDGDLATLGGAIEASSAPIPSAASEEARLVDAADETAVDAPSLGERVDAPDAEAGLDRSSPPVPPGAGEVARLVEGADETAMDAPGRDAAGREPTGDGATEIVVRAKMSSWIQVRDDAGNELLMTRLMRAGDTYRVPDRPGLRLLTGNAGALEILVGGEEAPAIGPVGAVRRDVALDPRRLLDGTATSE